MAFRLSLFISGDTARSYNAVRNVEAIVKQHLDGQCELEIIDIFKDPQRAEREKILATPTILRNEPLPKKKIMGEFDDHDAVADALEIAIHMKQLQK